MGSSTVFATVSTPGPPGPQGPPGTPGTSPVWIVAAGVPANTTGSNGDMYLNNLTGDVYGPKAGGVWGPIACNIKGPAGTPGYSPQYIVAAGPPSPAVGNNGDMFIDSTTSNVYGPKTNGVWGGVVCNIKGNTGAAGATGPQGPPGVGFRPMGAWAAGTTYAQGDQVTDANLLYISLQGGNTGHVPASSPTWWEPVGSGGSQTPWLSNIDGATFKLTNTGTVAVGNSGATMPDVDAGPHLIVGPTATAGSAFGEVTTCGNVTGTAGSPVGIFNFANYAIAAAEKRLAAICGGTDGAINSGATIFYNWNAGTVLESMRITHLGNVGIGTSIPNSANGGVGRILEVATVANTNPVLVLSSQPTSASQVGGIVEARATQAVTGDSRLGQLNWGRITDVTAGKISSVFNIYVNNDGALVNAFQLNPNGLGTFFAGLTVTGGSTNLASTSVSGAFGVSVSANAPIRIPFQNTNTGASSRLDLQITASYGGTGSSMFIGSANNAYGTGETNYIDFQAGNLLINGTSVHFSGNVGIGTGPIPPGNSLTVGGGSSVPPFRSSSGGNPTYYWDFGRENATTGDFIFTVASGSTATEKLRITAAGNVGIGMPNPLSALSVLVNPTPVTFATANQITVCEASNNSGYRLNLGYASVSGTFYGVVQAIAGGSGAALMLNPSGGMVGVAKVPFYQLDITGDCNITGTYRVNGVAIGAGGSGVGLTAQASSATTVTNAGYSDIPSCSLTLTQAGRWLIIGMFDCTIAGSDGATVVQGLLNANGTQQGQLCMAQAPGGNTLRVTVAQQWMLVLGSGVVVKLQAYRPSGTSTSTIGTNTTITAIWISAS